LTLSGNERIKHGSATSGGGGAKISLGRFGTAGGAGGGGAGGRCGTSTFDFSYTFLRFEP